MATSCEELTHWKRLWCWEGLEAVGEGTTEDEMAGWHHGLSGRESVWTPGVGDGQRGLACCDSWGHKELDTTEWLNWTELNCCIWESNKHVNIYYKIVLARMKLLICIISEENIEESILEHYQNQKRYLYLTVYGTKKIFCKHVCSNVCFSRGQIKSLRHTKVM